MNPDTLADVLDTAVLSASAIERLSAQHPIALADAYAIQRLAIDRRLARGDRLCGVKMGFTSRAKMRQMGVDEVIWGRLTDAMRIEDGGHVALGGYIHPRVEPEIAFLLGRRIEGRVSPAEAMAAVEAVCPAIELIDSRYTAFKFTHEDVVADNCSSAGFALGAWNAPRQVDNLGVLLEIDGRPVRIGSTAAILGDPARALAAAVRLASADGVALDAGTIVLAGAATEAVPLRPGCHVRVVVQDLGSAGFTVSQEQDHQ
jgi:2-oxo-3-hexenedioate decarboxylase